MNWNDWPKLKIVLPLIFIAALAVPYAIGFRVPTYGLFNDDGIYLSTAKSLATGHGYRILSLPDEMYQTKYPPMFPFSLAIIWKINPHFPQNLPLLKSVPLLCAIGWIWLAFIFVREQSQSSMLAAWTAVLVAASPWVLFLSVTCLSETMFALFLTATLLLLTRECVSARDSIALIFAASVFSAAAILTRTAGLVPLLFAGGFSLFMNRKLRGAASYLIATLACILPWVLWSREHSLKPGSVEEYYSGANYLTWNLFGNFTWHQRYVVIADNALFSFLAPGILMGFEPAGIGAVLCPLIGIFVVYGFILELRKGFTPLGLFLVAYEAMLLLWAVPPPRFLVPVLPFLILFGYIGFKHFLLSVAQLRDNRALTGLACGLVFVAGTIPAIVSQAREAQTARGLSLPDAPRPDWNQLNLMMGWLKQNTSEDAVLAGGADPYMYLATGRKAVRGVQIHPFDALYSRNAKFPCGTPSEFAANLAQEKVDYLVAAQGVTFGEAESLNALIATTVRQYPDAFSVAVRSAQAEDVIYKVDWLKLARMISQ